VRLPIGPTAVKPDLREPTGLWEQVARRIQSPSGDGPLSWRRKQHHCHLDGGTPCPPLLTVIEPRACALSAIDVAGSKDFRSHHPY